MTTTNPEADRRVALQLERAALLAWQHRYSEFDQMSDRLAEINAALEVK